MREKIKARVNARFLQFFSGYIGCALWTETDGADDSGGEHLDSNYSTEDFDQEDMSRERLRCALFFARNKEMLEKAVRKPGYEWSSAGHDFWLTRNGHGAGFWDRGLGKVGDKLSEAAHKAKERHVEVGDNGKLYFI